MTLKPKEHKMLVCISEWTDRYGFPPTMRELQIALGYRSSASVHYHIKRLASAGIISYEASKPRTLHVLDAGKSPT